MADMPLVFLDLETLGTTDSAQIFEAAWITEDGKETVIWIPVDVSKADEGALRVNRYYARFEEGYDKYRVEPEEAAKMIAKATAGAMIAGNNVGAFDTRLLRNFMLKYGLPPAWSHRVFEVMEYAAGALGMKAPFASRDVSKALGIPEQPREEAHTALADARWTKLVYETARNLKQSRTNKIKRELAPLISSMGPQTLVDDALVGSWADKIASAVWPQLQETKS